MHQWHSGLLPSTHNMHRKHNTGTPEIQHAVSFPLRRPGQSVAGFVREHLALIEQAIDHGVKAPAIVQSMAAAGAVATARSFEVALYRARVWRRRQPPVHGSVQRPEAAAPTAALPPSVPVAAVAPPKPAAGRAVRLTPTVDLKPDDLI